MPPPPDRHPSEPAIPNDRDLVLQQLITSLSELTGEVRDVGEAVNEVKLQLVAGSGRMNQLEERIDHNKNDLETKIEGVRKAVNDRVDGIEKRMDKHDREASQEKSRWSSVMPQVVAGVITAVLTAAIVGGLLFMNRPTTQPAPQQPAPSGTTP